MIEFCICRHSKFEHKEPTPSRKIRCRECWSEWANGWNGITESSLSHEFKLDNLKFIEDLAKERKLV